MPKIAFVGAGSTVFTRNLVGDVLFQPELRDSTEFALMDIDAERLRSAEIVAGRLVEAHGAGATVTATTDRRAALDGADYVVTSFQVGGYELDSPGYDLLGAFVGSEGTLGVATKVWLRVVPSPETVRTLVAYVEDILAKTA